MGNRGKLSLERRMRSGETLPNVTTTKFMYRAAGHINVGSGPYTSSLSPELFEQTSVADQIFCISDLDGPLIKVTNDMSTASGTQLSAIQNPAWFDLWSHLYSEYLVTGAKFHCYLKRPLYPSSVSIPTSNAGVDSSDTFTTAKQKPNVTHGFWYIRYRYAKHDNHIVNGVTPLPTAPQFVGHPFQQSHGQTELHHWQTMKEFQSDPTVTWIRDKLPKATTMQYSRPLTFTNHGPPLVNDVNLPLFPMTAGFLTNTGHVNTGPSFGDITKTMEAPSITYQLQLSNKGVRLIGAFSMRKHWGYKDNLELWGNWKPMTRPLSGRKEYLDLADLNSSYLDHLLMIGYVGFDSMGVPITTIPADGFPMRHMELTAQYKVHLRGPKVGPWDQEAFSEAARALNAGVPSSLDVELEDEEEDLDAGYITQEDEEL